MIVNIKRKFIVYTVCILLFYIIVYLPLVTNWKDNTSPRIYLLQKGYADVKLNSKEITLDCTEGMGNYFTATFNKEILAGYVCRNTITRFYYTRYMK